MNERHHGVRAGSVRHALLAAAALGLLASCTSFSSTHEKRADAQLQPTVGSQARGMVTLVERPDGVQVTYNLVGLPPNSDHALQVHERGDCNAGDGSSAGQVFAPAADRLRAGARVAGDLGNIHADANGVAAGFIVAPDLALDGVRSAFGRSALVHRDPSDPAFPQHGAGPALACGVIR
ncbi:superoxide dismutase family protein [Burkholderia ubonensis]|uniref:superoxide dismutase family protein n=1 Tax=Burkholderia ubonensis TaxID=101571 RepID=UPI00075AF598|nr:superoxide dismutase family protein [Burkholderia ubonensis]KVL75283.1 superoxide dismutase [Burkholderia ubonensis]KVL84574.1 superoxide dismutase [Burkholderia ubonensis]